MITKDGSLKSVTDRALEEPLKHSLEDFWPDFISDKERENYCGSYGNETLKSLSGSLSHPYLFIFRTSFKVYYTKISSVFKETLFCLFLW